MTELSDAEIEVLHEALDDEYKAYASYGQVIEDFGPLRPFTNIRDAEARHIDALIRLFNRFGVAVPGNNWPGRVPRYSSIGEACRAGVDGEIANAGMYERLMKQTSRAEILTVLGNLQRASQENHLPAFQRCAGRGSDPTVGQSVCPGRGRGRRRRGHAE